MALKAFTNRQGSHVKDTTFTNRTRVVKPDGSETLTTSYITLREALSRKTTTIKTIPVYIAGIPWRMPTNYGRAIENYTYTSGERVTKSGPPDAQTVKSDYGISADGPQNLNHPMVRSQFDIIDTDGHRQAVTECLLKLNERKVSFGQYLAESRKSANMLADAGKELLTLLRHVKRGNIRAIPKDFGVIRRKGGGYFLQWEYGWKPLASDIHGLYEFSKGTLQKPLIFSAERNIRSHYYTDDDFNGQHYKMRVTHNDRCKLWARISDKAYYAAQNTQVNNPAALGWELVPYSFVFDWFVPVGNYLDALTATAGMTFVAGYRSQSRQAQFDMDIKIGKLKKEVFVFGRQKLNSFPSGRIYAKQNPFNTKRIGVLLALFNQNWKGKR